MHAKVYRPTGRTATQPKKLAPRLSTLRGARIGMLDNCKEFADHVLKGLAESLTQDCGAAEVRVWRKGYPGKGAPAPLLAEMAEACDAVVNGVGH